jgi:hypothetical protein
MTLRSPFLATAARAGACAFALLLMAEYARPQ